MRGRAVRRILEHACDSLRKILQTYRTSVDADHVRIVSQQSDQQISKKNSRPEERLSMKQERLVYG